MTEYIVSCVIRNLGELLEYEAKNIPDLRGRIEVIQTKLRQLQSILEIADAKREIDEGIRNWITETTEVAYDIEDLLTEAVSSRKEGTTPRKSTHFFKVLEPKIKVIEAKVNALESDLRIRNIKPRQREITPNEVSRGFQHQTRTTYPHQVKDNFVGLDKEVNGLVATLTNEDVNNNYKVISITGMGGIGKTEITKRIYHHANIRTHFQAFAWAYVSQQWQPENILQKILNNLEPEKKMEIHSMKVEELVDRLFEVQKRKRCLIVIDDVWEMEVWDILRPVFVNKLVNIKVLLTTRNNEIARYINIDAPCYIWQHRYLNENEGWDLLKKTVYRGINIAGTFIDENRGDVESSGEEEDDAASNAGSFQSCNSDVEEDEVVSQLQRSSSEDQDKINLMDMERLGKEMIVQCGGLPLAIDVLGGLLMTKSTISEWRTVHQNLTSYLRKGRSYRETGRVYEVLALSYHDLPYQLKPCFLHLGNFPEASEIPTRKLYQLWAAEGFLSQESYQEDEEEEESVMDIGERYLGELVQRCMVQVRVEEHTGRFQSCKLNDLTRELCFVKGKEENFLKKVPLRYEQDLTVSPSSPMMMSSIKVPRRLSISVDHDFDSYFPPYKKENLDHIRSALFFSRLTNRRNLQSALEFLCNEMKLLRVLDLERFDFGEKLPKGIGNLVHLRYLGLRGARFLKLPSSIANLKYLQTLDLRVPFLVCLVIPNVLFKLKNLKHLYLPPSHTSTAKLQLSTLTKLEILKNFDTRVSDYRDILKLTKLNKLAAILTLEIESLSKIVNSLNLEHKNIRDSSFRIRYDFQSERETSVLTELVGSTHLRKLDLIGVIGKMPDHILFANSLTKLTLRGSRLKEDPMATLEKLPCLYSLILRKNSYEGNEMCCSSQGFTKLGIMEIQGLFGLEDWRIEEGAMSNLYCLKIDECVRLKKVPEGIKHIAALRELEIINMPDAFKSRLRKVGGEGGEDIYKVEHITTITITETNRSPVKTLDRGKSGSFSGLFISIPTQIVPKEWKNA